MNARRGWTLVELLATLLILGLLASLLVAALAGAREKARRVQCVSSVRQLGLACSLYWDDHEGRAFRYRQGPFRGGVTYWFGWIEDGPEGARRFDPTQGALHPYLESRKVAICPSLQYALRSFKLKASGPAHGYGYNLNLSTPTGLDPIRVASALRPSDLATFADAAQVNTFQPPASPDHPMLEEFYYVHPGEATAHFRHSARANAVFSDGHVGPESMEAGSIDLRLPSARVGRLRSEILLLRP